MQKRNKKTSMVVDKGWPTRNHMLAAPSIIADQCLPNLTKDSQMICPTVGSNGS